MRLRRVPRRLLPLLAALSMFLFSAFADEADPFKPSEKLAKRLTEAPKDAPSKQLAELIGACEQIVATLDKEDPVVRKWMPRLRHKLDWLYTEYNAVNPREYNTPNMPFDKALPWVGDYDLKRALNLLAEKKDPEDVRRGKQPTGAYLDISRTEGFLASWDLFIPKNYDKNKKHPLIICFQTSMSAEACSEQGCFLVQSFQRGPPKSAVHYAHFVAAMIHETAADFNIDLDRVYLTGFSTGGATAFLTAYQFPDLFAGVIPVCPAAEWRDPGARHAHNVATFVMYGKGDSWTAKGATPILQRLKESEHPDFDSYPYDAGHDPKPVLYTDTAPFFAFIEKHKRNPNPKKVWKWIEHKRYASAYWLVGKLKQDGKCQGGIVAEIKDGNVVDLTTTDTIAAVALYLNEHLVDMKQDVTVVVNGKEKYKGSISDELYVEILDDHKGYWQDAGTTRLNPHWTKARLWPGPGEKFKPAPWMNAAPAAK